MEISVISHFQWCQNSYNILLDNIFGSVAPNQSHRDKHVIGMISQEMFRKYVLKHKSAKLLGKLLKSFSTLTFSTLAFHMLAFNTLAFNMLAFNTLAFSTLAFSMLAFRTLAFTTLALEHL